MKIPVFPNMYLTLHTAFSKSTIELHEYLKSSTTVILILKGQKVGRRETPRFHTQC